MLVLVVDTATPAITAGLCRVDEAATIVLARRVQVDARAHGELLAPAIDTVLREGGARAADLAAIVAGVGPGPFTGLRVGLVTAATLADAICIPAYGVCTLDALGRAAGAGPALVATDARRREVYWGLYRDGIRVAGPAVDKPADLPLADGATRYAAGDGALRYAEVLAVPVRDEPRYPPVEDLLALATDRIRCGAPAEPLTPLYLRRPDAVARGAAKRVTP